MHADGTAASASTGGQGARARELVAVALLAVLLWVGLLAAHHQRAGEGFDFTRWEISSVANKWLFALGAPLRDDPASDAAVARYFALDDRAGGEARELENAVEAAIEGRIDAALRSLGIGGRFALPGPLTVWPPVDFELAPPPRVLAVSPRGRIELLRSDVLFPGLAREAAAAVERVYEAEHPQRSALVVGAGGIATYPAMVSDRGSYASTVETAAHEWVHHYLAFYPLGAAYFRSDGARVINEAVADIVGAEIAALVLEDAGMPIGERDDGTASSIAGREIDRDAALRALRLEVDALLSEGRIEEAERRMAQVQDELAASGVVIRRLNQAYFAWIGTYATRGDSVDPLGAELVELRGHAGTLARFLALVRVATDRSDVVALLPAR